MRKNLKFYRLMGMMTAIIFLFLGISQNQHHSTFQKAIRICLECIGVG